MKNFKIHYQNGQSSLVKGDKFTIDNHGWLYISRHLEEVEEHETIFIVKPEHWTILEIIDIEEEIEKVMDDLENNWLPKDAS